MKKVTFLLSFILAAHFLTAQGFINVPGDYPTIQEGIDAAVAGETVLVQPGTYLENINFNGKNITVGSLYFTTLDTSYISQTIIDGNAAGTVVTLAGGEDGTALLTGFTITNGFTEDEGGGIYIHASSPSIEHLTVSANTADVGGGIYVDSSSATFYEIVLKNNSGDGGGIACISSDAGFDNIQIVSNTAPHFGGALYCVESPVSFTNSTFESNAANNFGGAVFCWDTANIYLENVIIKTNTAQGGGGMALFDSDPVLKNVTLAHNTATKSGGGISCDNSIPVFDNSGLCNVYLNSAAEGNDFFTDGLLDIELDTFSVMSATDFYTSPLGNYTLTINNAKKEQTAADLFVSPEGDDANSGTTTDEPLKTIHQATSLILADSNQKRTITLMEGTFSPFTNGEIFPVNIPDYISIKGTSPLLVVLDADSSAGVMEFLFNKDSHISGLSIQGGGTAKGAGIYAELSELNIENVKIKNNTASYGAGIFFDECDAVLTNVLLSDNEATNNGGGIYFTNSNAHIRNSTIADNVAGQMAGGVHNYRSLLYLINTILWNDTPQELAIVSSGGTGNYGLIILNSDVQGGEANIENPGSDFVSWHESNIDEDPVFLGEWGDLYQINNGSPCIDAGTPDTAELNLPEFDLGGDVRIFNYRVDIGAYEWNLFVGMEESIESKLSEASVFPNPVNDRVTVLLNNQQEGVVTIDLFNASGAKVKGFEAAKLQTEKWEFTFDTSKLKPGIYFLQLQVGSEVLTRKLVKK